MRNGELLAIVADPTSLDIFQSGNCELTVIPSFNAFTGEFNENYGATTSSAPKTHWSLAIGNHLDRELVDNVNNFLAGMWATGLQKVYMQKLLQLYSHQYLGMPANIDHCREDFNNIIHGICKRRIDSSEKNTFGSRTIIAGTGMWIIGSGIAILVCVIELLVIINYRILHKRREK